MKKKVGFICIVAVFAISTLGMSYGGDSYAAFVQSSAWDNETDDVAEVIAYIDNPGGLIISITDAYPGYEAYVSFRIQHIGEPGDPTIYIDLIDIINGNETALNITVTKPNGDPLPLGTPLDPRETLDGLVTIKIKEGAEQDKSYTFGIDFEFSYEII